jgi:hypothetical protein
VALAAASVCLVLSRMRTYSALPKYRGLVSLVSDDVPSPVSALKILVQSPKLIKVIHSSA